MEGDGIVSSVLYEAGGSHRVLALKKMLAGLLSVDQNSGTWSDNGDSVVVTHEGPPRADGVSATKTTTIDRENSVITEVISNENVDQETG